MGADRLGVIASISCFNCLLHRAMLFKNVVSVENHSNWRIEIWKEVKAYALNPDYSCHQEPYDKAEQMLISYRILGDVDKAYFHAW